VFGHLTNNSKNSVIFVHLTTEIIDSYLAIEQKTCSENIPLLFHCCRNQYGNWLRNGRPGFDCQEGQREDFFFVCHRVQIGPEATQPRIQFVPGALSLEIERSGREADHSALHSAEVNNAWSYTSTPPYNFMVWCLLMYRYNFIFFLLPTCAVA
jgi:hypothetical protein